MTDQTPAASPSGETHRRGLDLILDGERVHVRPIRLAFDDDWDGEGATTDQMPDPVTYTLIDESPAGGGDGPGAMRRARYGQMLANLRPGKTNGMSPLTIEMAAAYMAAGQQAGINHTVRLDEVAETVEVVSTRGTTTESPRPRLCELTDHRWRHWWMPCGFVAAVTDLRTDVVLEVFFGRTRARARSAAWDWIRNSTPPIAIVDVTDVLFLVDALDDATDALVDLADDVDGERKDHLPTADLDHYREKAADLRHEWLSR